MNRKNSILFVISLIAFLSAFTYIFYRWAKSDFRSSPSIEAQLKKDLPETKNLSTQSQVAGSATTNQNTANSATQQNQASQNTGQESQLDTASRKDPLPGDANPQNTSEETKPEKKTFSDNDLKISFDYEGDLQTSKGINSLTVSNSGTSWKMKFYDNKKKEDIETWFKNRYKASDNPSCTFAGSDIKAGSLVSKLVKAGTSSDKCEDGGDFFAGSDNSRIMKVEKDKETADNINKVLANFKFLD